MDNINAHDELLASYRAVLDLAERATCMARRLADAHRTHRRLPDALVEDYMAQAAQAEHGIERLRAMLSTLQRPLARH